MAKHKEEETQTSEQEAAVIAARDANRPIAGRAGKVIDDETASHQWQAGSPAIDTNVNSENSIPKTNILDKVETPENIEAKEAAAKSAAEAYDNNLNAYDGDCSKLDVSDPRYCQPGSERHLAWTKKSK